MAVTLLPDFLADETGQDVRLLPHALTRGNYAT
jgi:hypothetical protein